MKNPISDIFKKLIKKEDKKVVEFISYLNFNNYYYYELIKGNIYITNEIQKKILSFFKKMNTEEKDELIRNIENINKKLYKEKLISLKNDELNDMGLFLRLYRYVNGISITEVADKLCVNYRYLLQIEKDNQHKLPPITDEFKRIYKFNEEENKEFIKSLNCFE